MLSPIAVRKNDGRGIVSALALLFILGYFTPLVPVSSVDTEVVELDLLSEFETSARSGTGWAKMAGGSANGNARYIDVVPSSGDIAIGGLMDGGAATMSWGGVSVTSGDTVTPWYAKTDSGGNVSWVQVATASGSNSPAINAGGLAISNSGDVYVTGSFRDTASFGSHTLVSQGLYDCFIAKISSSGQWQWAKSLKGNGDAQTGATTTLDVVWGTSITVDVGGNAIIGGFYLGSTEVGTNAGTGIGDADVFVAKYSSSGSNNWLADATGPDTNEVFSMTSDMGGDVWLVSSFDTSMSFGSYSVSASGGGHPVIAKISSQGGWLDAQHGTTTSNTYTGGIDVDISGDPVIAGIFSGSLTFGSSTINSMGEDDGFVAKYSAGSWVWATHVGTSTYDFISDVATDPSSGNAIVALSSAGSMSLAGSSFSSQ